MKFCIDAGHGGTDTGAINGQLYEKNANLAIAQKLGDKLKRKGHTVIYTREKDKSLMLQKRCDISNESGCDFFVSIHCNGSTNKNASGIETFKFPNINGITRKLAVNIQDSLIKNFPEEKNRGVKEEKYYVLKNTKCPAVLVEVGFITHDETAKKLFNSTYQDKLATAICDGILKTLDA